MHGELSYAGDVSCILAAKVLNFNISGSHPENSTTERIIALRFFAEPAREFWQWQVAANVNLKNFFFSVHPETLCDVVRICGIIECIGVLMTDLNSKKSFPGFC